jgi:predicted permease
MIAAAMATPGFLRAIGVNPVRGRLLAEGDLLPHGSGTALVLSYELWQTEFGGDPDIVGRTITASSGGDGRVLRDAPLTVVGVLPEGVEVPRLGAARAWFPLQLDPRSEEYRSWRGFVAIGRLADGVTEREAELELNRIQSVLADTYPDAVRNWSVQVVRLRDWVVGETRSLLLLFLAAVGIVLAIVCVNLVGLLLARARQRERELAVRAALGATRSRLAGQLLLEAALLSVMGGLVGVLLALWLVDAFIALAPPGIPRIADVTLDARVLAFTIAFTVATGLLFGMAPAARIGTLPLHDTLKLARGSGGDRRGNRVRAVLVVAQIALAVTLVLSSGLLLRSLARMVAFDPGFRLAGLLTFQVYPPMWRYETPERLADFYARAEEAIEAIPGVEGAGTTSAGPLLGGGDGRTPFVVHGRPPVPIQDAPTVEWYNAGPGYFPTLGVPITRGRNLLETDRLPATPAALISESMAARHWADGSPLGARLSLPEWDTDVEIVGVVPDLRRSERQAAPEPAIFVSDRQRPRGASFFVVRTTVAPALVAPAVRRAFARLDPEVEPRYLMTMEDLLAEQLVAPRFNVLLIGLFAALALVLSASGIYAVVAYAVATRTREFGIRMALGSPRGRVLRSVLLDGTKLLAAGLGVGLAGAFFFTRLLRGLIHEIAPADPLAVTGTVLLVVITALAATLAPALRASRAQPSAVLRSE